MAKPTRGRGIPTRAAAQSGKGDQTKMSPNDDVSKPEGPISSKGSIDYISPFASEWAAFAQDDNGLLLQSIHNVEE